MFLKDFLAHFNGTPDNFWVNVRSIDRQGHTFYIYTQEQFDESDEKISSLKEDLRGEVSWRKELQKEIEEQKKEINGLELIVRKIDEEGISVKEIVRQNGELIRKIAEWRKNNLDLTAKIEKLQARKNKATITERDAKTGQFIAEYQGVKYLLTKL